MANTRKACLQENIKSQSIEFDFMVIKMETQQSTWIGGEVSEKSSKSHQILKSVKRIGFVRFFGLIENNNFYMNSESVGLAANSDCLLRDKFT